MKNKSIKEQILELTGMSEKKFYDKYQNPEDFKKDYPKEFAKILRKGGIVKAQPGFQSNFSPAPLQMETYDFAGNQKAIDKAANKVRRQNLSQGIGLDSNEGVIDESIQQKGFVQNLISGISNTKPEKVQSAVDYSTKLLSNINKVRDAAEAKKEEKDRFKTLDALNPLITQAASSQRERIQRNYLRPEEQMIEPDTLHNPLGTGPGLYAKNGGEIANTYAPNTLYKDLEQAAIGAVLPLIQEGVKAVGKTMDVAGDIGAFAMDLGRRKYQKKNEQLMGQMAIQPGIQGLQSPYVSHMEHGGFVNPQVASSLEGIPMKKLFAPDPTMDTLRTGGHIRQNNISAMDGKMKATWGGFFEPVAESPSLPGSGQMVKIRGKSHDEKDPQTGQTGVGISVGNDGEHPLQHYAEYGTNAAIKKSSVEAQRGEPAIEQVNPNGSMSIVIHGGQKLTKLAAEAIGDPKRVGQKIQNISLDYGGKISKAKKQMDNAIEKLGGLKVNTPYDKLTQSSFEAIEKGSKIQQDIYADKLVALTAAQDWINETEKAGIDPKSLDRGKFQQAKFGGKISSTSAQKGKTISQEEYNEAMKLYKSGKIKEFQQLGMKLMPEYVKSLGVPTISKKFDDGIDGTKTKALLQEMEKSKRDPLPDLSGFKVDVPNMPSTGNVADAANTALDYFRTENAEPFQENYPTVTPRNKNWLFNAFNQAVRPYLLPSDTEGLAIEQVAPEYMALAQNQVEPVQAQKVPLRLMSPQQVSYADQLAQVQSDYRAAQRMAQINPAAASNLAAQKYAATRNILGEEFRANQAMRDAVQSANYAAMAQNDLLNLQQLDQQYVRQQQAIANTKAVKQAAVNSINAKILQNRLANRQLGITENMYNYRFDEKGRAINVNPLMAFVTDMDIPVYDNEGNLVEYKRQDKEKIDKSAKQKPTNAKNGTLVKAMK